MKLRAQIESAFAHRKMPSKLIEASLSVTPEQGDALTFTNRHWSDVGWQDWQNHPDAFYAFVPEAFRFYLPSILIGSMDAPKGQLLTADALIGILDRSPEVSHWDLFLTQRMVGLEPAEYEALKDWLLSRSGVLDSDEEDSLARAYETIELLAHESARLPNLFKVSSAKNGNDQ